ncbi:MAG: Gfo/Idh/MocA family oxidoreductase [Candidatus Cloacimonetes bacterium]|nr:Gfo/Idh/MocA family oxidoreductase [Candidatus Cloacimonadota bacterium]
MKIGVIGVGHLGQHHARVFSELDNAELIGIYDIDHSRATLIAEKNHCKAFETVEELLLKVDAISIAAPTITHFEYCKKCLENNKNVFVEKPICSNLNDAKKLVSLADKKNLKIQVGHIERFNPAIMALSDILISPIFIEANRIAPFTPRGSDVPVVLDLMIHDIDIILSLVKSKVKSINAVGVPILTDDIDIANAKIEFENGALANITASRISLKRERKIRFFQKDMYISLNYQNKDVQVVKKNPEINRIMQKIMSGKQQPNISEMYHTQKVEIIEREPLKTELQNFVDAIKNNKRPIVNGQDGYEALRIAFMIMESIKKSRKETKLI